MFSYATAETVLARLHGADQKVQRAAFRGRLKHLKRLGIPRGINPGRGAKVWYDDAQIYEWAFCLELAEFGLDPTTTVGFMERHWAGDLLPKLLTDRRRQTPDGDDLYFFAYPQLMADAWAPSKDEAIPYRWVRRSESERWVHRLIGTNRRAIIINVSSIVREIDFLRVQVDSAAKAISSGRKKR